MVSVKTCGAVLFLATIVYLYLSVSKLPPLPKLEDTWWGPGQRPDKEDTAVRPFKINVPEDVIRDLQDRLRKALPFQPPLEGANHHYGLNTDLLSEIVEYWKNDYDWDKRQQFLNQYPQFQTTIQGLKIHFLHVKPKVVPKGVEVVPLLVVHGWPGSVREFYEVLPIWTTPQEGRNFVFEVIVPSLPGYGFSDAPVRSGLGPGQIARVFANLMSRLGFQKYYLQGGDWGALVTQLLAVLHPGNVLGLHRNLCYAESIPKVEHIIGILFPSLFFTPKEIEKIYPLGEKYAIKILETGYMNLQATKPDTVGVAVRDSPVGLAAYIIEKFIFGTNPEFKNMSDGRLAQKFGYEKLLDNVMIYWVSRSFTTSARLYAEHFTKAQRDLGLMKYPITVPAGCNRFEHEIQYPAEYFLRKWHTNLIHLTDFEDGGHFVALEVPEVFANDVYQFVEEVRNLAVDKKL